MKLKAIFLGIFFLTAFSGFSQNLNGYKYVIIPKKFDFQKTEDKYQLNSLTKFLFEKEGFKTLFHNEKLPQDLYENSCLALKAKVIDASSMFTTKLKIDLVDCNNQDVFSSIEGKSKEKDLKKGYHDALRKAFASIKKLDYKFDNSQVAKVPSGTYVSEDEAPITTNVDNLVIYEGEDIIEEDVQVKASNESKGEFLYAQNISNGFQLVDSTPKIVFKALKSNKQDMYYLQNQAGVLYKEDSKWFAEYYKNGKLIKEELNIKF